MKLWQLALNVILSRPSRKVESADTVEDLYRRSSCVNYFDGISVPMVFINAVDDPVVPPQCTNIIKEATSESNGGLVTCLRNLSKGSHRT